MCKETVMIPSYSVGYFSSIRNVPMYIQWNMSTFTILCMHMSNGDYNSIDLAKDFKVILSLNLVEHPVHLIRELMLRQSEIYPN